MFEIPFGKKIDELFSDKVWNNLGSNFDKNSLHDLLNRCADLRNDYFHFRDDQIDIKLLKDTWNILKRELMDEYMVKHLLKKNKEMSKSEAEKKLLKFGMLIASK